MFWAGQDVLKNIHTSMYKSFINSFTALNNPWLLMNKYFTNSSVFLIKALNCMCNLPVPNSSALVSSDIDVGPAILRSGSFGLKKSYWSIVVRPYLGYFIMYCTFLSWLQNITADSTKVNAKVSERNVSIMQNLKSSINRNLTKPQAHLHYAMLYK